jgi:nucleotide-binding universal stress UspA family protein
MTVPTVVVGCDASPASDPALRFAAEEARLRHARLVVIAAYDRPIDPDLDDFDTPESELQKATRVRTETALHRALPILTVDDVDLEIVAAEGEPSQVLLGHSTDAVMIVIGSHDRPMLQRLFGRVTSRGLLHDSTVPITIVPSPTDRIGAHS